MKKRLGAKEDVEYYTDQDLSGVSIDFEKMSRSKWFVYIKNSSKIQFIQICDDASDAFVVTFTIAQIEGRAFDVLPDVHEHAVIQGNRVTAMFESQQYDLSIDNYDLKLLELTLTRKQQRQAGGYQ